MAQLDLDRAGPLVDDDDSALSSHTISMRNALSYCREMSTGRMDVTIIAMEDDEPLPRVKTATDDRPDWMDFMDVNEAFSVDSFSREFQKYLQHNQPCLLRGCTKQSWFQRVHNEWVDQGTVQRNWFVQTIGADTCVPVRQLTHLSSSGPTHETSALDAQGRATECETKHMTLRDYTTWMDQTRSKAPSLYLKDWHLQAWLEQHGTVHTPLYEAPPFFPHDLLNAFLRRFTAGDYRFVYWGPPGSYTALHSDVLNSYSWSYNVVGTKEWTFHVPGCTDGTTVQVVQAAGDLMFVPSEWQHSVLNVTETLSINHNWITTDNVPRVWDCIAIELAAVHAELHAWSIDGFEARENMLRGCIGLDVTSFFFMLLTRGCELLQNHASEATVTDMVRIHDALAVLTLDQHGTIQLLPRLKATLASEQLGEEAIAIANSYVKHVQTRQTQLE